MPNVGDVILYIQHKRRVLREVDSVGLMYLINKAIDEDCFFFTQDTEGKITGFLIGEKSERERAIHITALQASNTKDFKLLIWKLYTSYKTWRFTATRRKKHKIYKSNDRLCRLITNLKKTWPML